METPESETMDCEITVGNADYPIVDLAGSHCTMYQSYWEKIRERDSATLILPPNEKLSCIVKNDELWFVDPDLDESIRSLHQLVRNANTRGRKIVVGAGSTQLLHAALYAVASVASKKMRSKSLGSVINSNTALMKVVAQSPYQPAYPAITNLLQSQFFTWAGDAASVSVDKKKLRGIDNSYIEFVTFPNNPDGTYRKAVVSGSKVIHDLAYYWPQYTPIQSTLDYDIMIFSLSKCLGHGGTRIGWAIVKDEEIVRRMAYFIEIASIGVSQVSQMRAAVIIQSAVSHATCDKMFMDRFGRYNSVVGFSIDSCIQENMFFHHGYLQMKQRWEMLRDAISGSPVFSVLEFNPAPCLFFCVQRMPYPAFAWIKSNDGKDCHIKLQELGVNSKQGTDFGVDNTYARVSMMDTGDNFKVFIKCLRNA